MDMFKKYDADGSGEIDKAEFRAIAKEIQADARRRNLISVAAAAVGAVSIYDAYCDDTLYNIYLDIPIGS